MPEELQDEYARTGLRDDACDLGLEDPHLLLGVTMDTALEMYSVVMSGYNRAQWFESKGREDFITKHYGEAHIGYDVAEACRKWLGEHDYEHLSVAEAWMLEKRGGVAKASVFLSHTQVQGFLEFVAFKDRVPVLLSRQCAPDSAQHFWIDYFVIRQCTKDFKPPLIFKVIQHINCTVAVEDGCMAKGPTYLDRSFCVFEIACTPADKLIFVPSPNKAAEYFITARVWIFLTVFLLIILAFVIWGVAEALDSPVHAAIWALLWLVDIAFKAFVRFRARPYNFSLPGRGTERGFCLTCDCHKGWVRLAIPILNLALLFVFCRRIDFSGVSSAGRVHAGLQASLAIVGTLLAYGVTAIANRTLLAALRSMTAYFVDVRRAQATRPEDKQLVDEFIRDHLGGFKAVNRSVKRAIYVSIRSSGRWFAAGSDLPGLALYMQRAAASFVSFD